MSLPTEGRPIATAVDLDITLRAPVAEDGPAVTALIANCPPLDPNSAYCNLLQCSHFADTAIAATAADGQLLGFISGYRIPARPDTLFVWQVAVSSAARGQGLGRRMLRGLIERLHGDGIRFVETTITADNDASWALFRGFARSVGADIAESTQFDRERHFNGQHASEQLLRIGPITGPLNAPT
ncbi:MAG TPA: diaminobutyrate acetyltransferase [Spongiibacteraceae bacterium]|jgi:L-2,4-diaminobutyric acid acetyltransferase|nr:diaminobutyrate acetyltransferase [Spongiibacteraceae bacterium]HUH38777.1 diaminobutyrate acetyltransferase [Spongiibacteraceae bacterium]